VTAAKLRHWGLIEPNSEAKRREAMEGTLRWFWERVISWARRRSRRVPKLSLRVGCSLIQAHRRASKRAFMHTHHLPRRVCAAPEAALLPAGHIVALLLHEIGHPLANALYGRSEQEDADRSVKEVLGVAIRYKGPLLLEWVPSSVVDKILGR
jgi:hypothetical protein